MSNMVGVGPFITIPLLMSALMGPQSLLGWFVALIICLADGMIWSELGAKMPGSGGSYLYLKEAFGPKTWGRLMAFLFIWQFILSGPLEIASGYIGFCNYLEYIWPNRWIPKFGILTIDPIAILVAIVTIALLYRKNFVSWEDYGDAVVGNTADDWYCNFSRCTEFRCKASVRFPSGRL